MDNSAEESNSADGKPKRSRAEDFFSTETTENDKSSASNEVINNKTESSSKRRKQHSSPSRDETKQSRKESRRAKRAKDDKDSDSEPYKKRREGRSPVHRRRKRRDRSSSVEDNEPIAGRYWDRLKESSEKPDVFKSKSKDSDYEVGSRYYEKPKDDIPASEEPEDPEKYLVGQRYYENKPEKKNEKSARLDKFEGKNPPERPAKKVEELFTSKTGGAYIPPAKLRLMQASITDKTSVAYQRIAWEALKKSIHGHINKVNTSNIGIIARLLMKENIVRGRGLLCRSILQAQAASPTFTNVYACLVNVINSRFPNIGELLLKRVILQFKRGFKRNDKPLCIASCQFIAHLVNQQVAHEIIALEMLTLLLENPTDDSVEVAVAFLKECGQKLLEVSPRGCSAIFDMLRNILHEGSLDKRVQYMIEVVFQVRKDGFASFPTIAEGLDLVEEEDQYTHILTLDEATESEDLLNVFKHDPTYEENEEKYRALKVEIIGESSGSEVGESGESGSEGEDSDTDSDGEEKQPNSEAATIIDNTETNLIALRRTIYLTVQSSLDFEECCHKLLKMQIKPGQESELCNMLLDCCAELRSYEKFFGLLAQRFCQINRTYIGPFEDMFRGSYSTVHRLDTNKLRNVARFFAHLLYTDAISWQVLDTILLNEEDTTSSSRIFIKILFQELAEYMGLANLNQRLKDPTYQLAMEGLFPRDNPKNTRFAINFFTSIGLGGLTDELREHLKSQPKPSAIPQLIQQLSSDSSSSDDSSSESSSSESSDSSDSSDEEEKKRKKKKNNAKNSKKESDKRDKSSEDGRWNRDSRDGRNREDNDKHNRRAHKNSRDGEGRREERNDWNRRPEIRGDRSDKENNHIRDRNDERRRDDKEISMRHRNDRDRERRDDKENNRTRNVRDDEHRRDRESDMRNGKEDRRREKGRLDKKVKEYNSDQVDKSRERKDYNNSVNEQRQKERRSEERTERSKQSRKDDSMGKRREKKSLHDDKQSKNDYHNRKKEAVKSSEKDRKRYDERRTER